MFRFPSANIPVYKFPLTSLLKAPTCKETKEEYKVEMEAKKKRKANRYAKKIKGFKVLIKLSIIPLQIKSN